MFKLFGDVKPYLKPKPKAEVPRPDNLTFKLHYKVTFAFLCVACILVSTYAYIDKSEAPIQCLMDKGIGVPADVINRYCWIMSTFTLPRHYNGTQGKDFIYQGVGPHNDNDEKVFHAYYQWVPLVLAFQAVLFYFPHWLWKTLEGGRMKGIIFGLNKAIEDEKKQKESVELLAQYMKDRSADGREHQYWALKFFICEVLNFVNVIAQILITDKFLGGEFTKYGTSVISQSNMDPEDRTDPMYRVFPRMTKCTFHKYGGSGTIQQFDALCVLSMNIVNEKIYIFLWFWFIILAIITAIHLLMRIAQYFVPNVRDRKVQLQGIGYYEGQSKAMQDFDYVISNVNYSNWLILYYLAQCMEKKNFIALVEKMNDQVPYLRLKVEDDTPSERDKLTSFDDEVDQERQKSRNDSTLRSSIKLRDFFPMTKIRREQSP